MSSSPPVRLRVEYKHADSVIREFMRSVGQGSVALESRKPLPAGTRFVFELRAHGYDQPVEVLGEVVAVANPEAGRYSLTVRYEPTSDRAGLDALLAGLLKAQSAEKIRKHARIPLQLQATEEPPHSRAYRVLDLSQGGMGMEVAAPNLPGNVEVGAPFLADFRIGGETLALHGEVAWTVAPASGEAWSHPRLGVHFGRLREDARDRLEKMLLLQSLPPPPWKARVSFGREAVARMP